MDINQLIAHNGACFYSIIFLWTFLEGETIVIFAGFAVAQGLVDPLLLLGAAWLGSFAGDQLYFWGVRNFSSFALGLSAVRWERFFRLNFAAAGLWAATFIAIGYFLGHAFNAVLGDLARSFSLVMLGVFVAIGFGMWLLHRLQRRRQLVRVPPGADVVLPPP